jgi:hypothetical protein
LIVCDQSRQLALPDAKSHSKTVKKMSEGTHWPPAGLNKLDR